MNVAVPSILLSDIEKLAARLEGELHHDTASRRIYATDASEYQEMPLAVAFPKTEDDLRQLILFAGARGIGLIPRAAGTSLAGQVVGHGIVVDIGKHLNRVLDYEADQRRVRVQPGVIRDDLNRWLNARGVFFAPETSTANRAMIGGMAAIKDHVKVGPGARLTGGAQVMHDVPAGETWGGSPAIPLKQAARQVLALQKLPDLVKRIKGR